MKKILVIALIFSSAFVFGQDSIRHSIVNVRQISLSKGLFTHMRYHSTLSEFRKLTPGSMLLNRDLTGYRSSFYSYSEPLDAYSVLLGLRFRNKDNNILLRSNPVLRIGLTYVNYISIYRDFIFRTAMPYDTLVLQNTGDVFYIDSISEKGYFVEYNGDMLSLDISAVWNTRAKKRWAFFAGIGISAGLSISSITDVTYQHQSWLENSDSKNQDLFYYKSPYTNHEFNYESFRNKSSKIYSGYIPLGVEWRIGKKNEFLRKAYLFIEVRPGVSLLNIPETSTYSKTFLHHALGLRIKWE